MALELLLIDRNFYYYLKEPHKNKVSDFELHNRRNRERV